jgi:hypothetical protein
MKKDFFQNQAGPRIYENSKAGHNADQFSNILESGYKRASEAVLFFNEKGALSEKVINKAFFMYLSVKKDAQRTIMQKIARSMGFDMPFSEYLQDTENKYKDAASAGQELEELFAFVHEIAADELEFYLNYAAVENDIRTHSLLLMLADLAKEFLFDVKIWYINHKEANRIINSGLKEKSYPDFTIEEVLN